MSTVSRSQKITDSKKKSQPKTEGKYIKPKQKPKEKQFQNVQLNNVNNISPKKGTYSFKTPERTGALAPRSDI